MTLSEERTLDVIDETLFCEGEREDLIFDKARAFGQFLEISYHTEK